MFSVDETSSGNEAGEGGASSAEEERTAGDAVAAAIPPGALSCGGGGWRELESDASAGPSADEGNQRAKRRNQGLV